MSYYSYVAYATETGEFYYGYFDDLDKALEMHNSDQIPITRGKGPWTILFSQQYGNRVRAIKQARFYRTVKGQRFLKNILNF